MRISIRDGLYYSIIDIVCSIQIYSPSMLSRSVEKCMSLLSQDTEPIHMVCSASMNIQTKESITGCGSLFSQIQGPVNYNRVLYPFRSCFKYTQFILHLLRSLVCCESLVYIVVESLIS